LAISIHAVTPSFAAEIGDVDLGRPLSADDIAAIKAAFTRYAVLVFPDQTFDDESHLDFAPPLRSARDQRLRDPQGPQDASRAADGRCRQPRRREPHPAENDSMRLYQLGNRLWHTDSSFKRLPAYCSILHGRSIPPIGGQTEFADLRAAYDALPDATKRRLDGLVAWHSLMTSRAKLGFSDFDETEKKAFEPVPQVLVRRLQDSGRMSLYLASHAGAISGLPKQRPRRCSRS
jgi:alpha-ketoglutarate-dependent 2,4-dichlorophenoxyacetate dioxygenase